MVLGRAPFCPPHCPKPGFAGIDNPLFYLDNTMMVFGDATATVSVLRF